LSSVGIAVNIELKNYGSAADGLALAQEVVSVTQTVWPQHRLPVLFSSVCEDVLASLYEIDVQLPLGMVCSEVDEDAIRRACRWGCLSIHGVHHSLDKDVVMRAKKAHLYLLAYTVNDLQRAQQLLSWGVQAVFSDHPLALKQVTSP